MTKSIVDLKTWANSLDINSARTLLIRTCEIAKENELLIEQQASEIAKLKVDSQRLDVIANGFSIWQNIEADGKESWHCCYGFGEVVTAHSLRDALDKGIAAYDARTNSKA